MTSIRPAQATDIPAIAHIHIEGWKAAYGGLVDPGYLATLSVEERRADWQKWMQAGDMTSFLALAGEKPAGFISWGRTRTAPPGDSPIRPQYPAEIYALYLLPEYWNKGIGKALLQAAFEDMAANKLSGACLWVVKGNERAIKFYEGRDGQRIGKKKVTIGPTSVTELCFGWRRIRQ